MEDKRIFSRLKEGDTQPLATVYSRHRGEFINWSLARYSINREEACDIFQSAILTFYENILTKKLTKLSCSIKTYLFSVARNLILERYREKNRLLVTADGLNTDTFEMIPLPKNDDMDERRYRAFKECLNSMQDPCKSVLVCFYYRNLSIKEIAQSFGYKNVPTAKNSKYKCLKRLKNCVFDKTGSNRNEKR